MMYERASGHGSARRATSPRSMISQLVTPSSVRMTSMMRLSASSARPAFNVSAPSAASRSTSSARRRALEGVREQLLGDNAGGQERHEHQPIERLDHHQRVVPLDKEVMKVEV